MNITDRLNDMEQCIAAVRRALDSENPSDWEEGANAADELGIYDDYAAAMQEIAADRKEAKLEAAAEAKIEQMKERGLL